MLVLSRRESEAIVIGQDVQVTVLQTRSGRVRLGIQAPSEMPVDRLEVRRLKERQQLIDQASKS